MATFMKFISKPPVDVYPLLGAVSVACGFGALMCYRTLARTQDCIVNKGDKDSWKDEERYLIPNYKTFLHAQFLPARVSEMRKAEIKYEK